jgi:signal transduction histidine kinase
LDLVNSQQSIQEWPIIYRILADEIDPRRIDFWKRSAIHVINVAFCNMLLISSVSALDLLACKDLMHDGSTGYLLLDPEVDCKSDSKIILRPFLIFFILFSALIYPVFCSLKIIKLHKGNHYHDEMMVHMYGNLFMRYKREVYWWEITILCKKSFLILALASFADSTLLLMASVLMILSISLIGTVYFKPYRSNLENNADLFSTFSQILIMFAGMYFYSVISFDPNKANSTFFFYVRQADICVWIIAVAIAVAILLCIYKDSYQLFEETGIKSIFLRLISISPQSERAAQDRLLKTAFLECDSDLMWRYGSSKNQKMVAAIEANSEGNQLNQNTSEFQNTSGAVALIQRQVLTVSSENKGLIAKISKLEMHYKSLKEDEEKRKKTTDDLEKVTEEAKRAISFLEVLKQDCDERVEKSQYWSEMLQSTRMQRQSLEKELLASKKMERSHALLIRTVNSQFNKADPTKTEKS